MIVDVHAHMDFESFDEDLGELLEKCKEAGVKSIVTNGVDPKTNRKTKEICDKHSILKPAYGYYPMHVIEDGVESVKKEIEWIKKQDVMAIGEVGLDYKEEVDGSLHKDVQQEGFRLMIRLAKELDKPIIIHSRKAESDVIDILEEEGAQKVVMHCFMGKKKYIVRAKELGYYFSVPVSVIKLEQLQWLVNEVPLRQLFMETDAPYLGPVMGERNDAQNIALSVKKVAEIKGMTQEDVKNHLFMNYQKVFL